MKTKNYLKENDCDLIALTYDGKIVDYTEYDQEVDEWVAQGQNYDWFCVELDED